MNSQAQKSIRFALVLEERQALLEWSNRLPAVRFDSWLGEAENRVPAPVEEFLCLFVIGKAREIRRGRADRARWARIDTHASPRLLVQVRVCFSLHAIVAPTTTPIIIDIALSLI